LGLSRVARPFTERYARKTLYRTLRS